MAAGRPACLAGGWPAAGRRLAGGWPAAGRRWLLQKLAKVQELAEKPFFAIS
jgi:hypothetical protein